MKKGCLIVGGIVGLLVAVMAFNGWRMMGRLKSAPKEPGVAELAVAEDFIRSYKVSEASGNTNAAIQLAGEFAGGLRESRAVLFSEGKTGAASLSKGRFLTYCFLKSDSVAMIVHVPELRRFTEDAKKSLEDYAWVLATTLVAAKHPEVKRMALGVKGVLTYSAILTGTINTENPAKGVISRHPAGSTDFLLPFFTPEKAIEPEGASEKETGGSPEPGD